MAIRSRAAATAPTSEAPATAPAPAAAPAATGGIRSRSRAPVPANTQTAPAASGGDWMKRGAAARQTAESEVARQRDAAERRASGVYMPYRFRLKVGEAREIVILDADLGICFYEHHMKNPTTGKWDIYETCPKEWEACPICEMATDKNNRFNAKESYYVMMLTCIDMTPYTKKDGTVMPYSKFLLPVKAQGQGFFMRLMDRHGTLRGIQLLMTRDTQQTASIGTPEFLEKHDEASIIESFGHPAVIGQQDGKVLKPANADCFPFPYDKLFKKPSGADLRRRYGGVAPMGSREEQDEWSREGHGNVQTQDAPEDGQRLDDDIPF